MWCRLVPASLHPPVGPVTLIRHLHFASSEIASAVLGLFPVVAEKQSPASQAPCTSRGSWALAVVSLPLFPGGRTRWNQCLPPCIDHSIQPGHPGAPPVHR